MPVIYDGIEIESGFKLDMVVDKKVVVELKAVESLLPIHLAQLLTYLKIGGFKLGFLVNFNVVRIKDGIRRVVR